MGSPQFFVVAHLFSFLCCVVFVCFVYLRPVSWMLNVASVSGLFIFVICLECPMLPVSLDCLSSSCALNAQCCQCLWIVYLRPVPWMPNVASVFGLFIFVLCLECPMLPVSLDCLSSSCALNARCWQATYFCSFPWRWCRQSISKWFFVKSQCQSPFPLSLESWHLLKVDRE